MVCLYCIHLYISDLLLLNVRGNNPYVYGGKCTHSFKMDPLFYVFFLVFANHDTRLQIECFI
jgi:hypothetical protein